MDPIEGWATLILFIVLVIILGHAWLNRLPEPTMGWECCFCRKKIIAMKSQAKKAGWVIEGAYICPDCQT
jgi:hypothetical protein